MERIWKSCPGERFEEGFTVCLVNIIRRGSPLFLPTLDNGADASQCLILVICEEESTWSLLQTEAERAKQRSSVEPMAWLLVSAERRSLASVADQALRSITADTFVFITQPTQFDVVALLKASDHHRACRFKPLKVDLFKAQTSGVRFPYGDYLRYRASIDAPGCGPRALPNSLENLLISGQDAILLAKRISSVPHTSSWQRLIMLAFVATRGMPVASPLVVGFHHDREKVIAHIAVDAKVSEPPAFGLELVTLLTTIADEIHDSEGDGADLLRVLGSLDLQEILTGASHGTNGEDRLDVLLARLTDMLVSALSRLLVDDSDAITLASLIVDNLRLDGLASLEIGSEAFEQQLVRAFTIAVLDGRLVQGRRELRVLLRRLCIIGSRSTWPIEADDLAWCCSAVIEAVASESALNAASSLDFQDKVARLDVALSAHLARDRKTPLELRELKGELAQVRAMLDELYPGRLATLIITTLRGSWRERLSFPLNLLRLTWQAVVIERRDRRRA